MPINDNTRFTHSAVKYDPTDNVYDETTGTYGPRQPESTFALRCDSCGNELSLDDLGNWVAAGSHSRADCTSCQRERERIERDALDDLDDIDKMLAEMEDGDH